MDSPTEGYFQRLKRSMRWSASWSTWRERLAFILLAVSAGMLAFVCRGLGWAVQLLLGALWLIVLAFLCHRGWLRLVGPVLFYDLVQTSRRQRYRIIRVLYASFLLFLLSWIYLVWFIERRGAGGISSTEMPKFASSFFYTFMLVQTVLVVILTPAYTAGTIADEKERDTLTLLLATDLCSREIVLSKMISRLLQISFFDVSRTAHSKFLAVFGRH